MRRRELLKSIGILPFFGFIGCVEQEQEQEQDQEPEKKPCCDKPVALFPVDGFVLNKKPQDEYLQIVYKHPDIFPVHLTPTKSIRSITVSTYVRSDRATLNDGMIQADIYDAQYDQEIELKWSAYLLGNQTLMLTNINKILTALINLDWMGDKIYRPLNAYNDWRFYIDENRFTLSTVDVCFVDTERIKKAEF
jgi:hypothetical protein